MMTSSNENIFRVTGPVCGEFTGHRWIPRQWRGAFIFYLIKGWVNNREAGDLRRHRGHYDVAVMCMFQIQQFQLVMSGDDETWNIMQQRLNGEVNQTRIV